MSISRLTPADSPRLAGEDEARVRLLAESEERLPPIVVHRSTMRVIDGMHRVRAAELRGQDRVEVQFFDGTDLDAFVLAVQLNAIHGLPLTHRDRIAAAQRIARSHPHWSDRMIASVTGLSAKTLSSLRQRSTEEIPQSNTRVGRDGRTRPLNAADARRLASRIITERPGASLREVATASGVALATARDVRERLRLGRDPVPAKLRRMEDPGRTAVEPVSERPGTGRDAAGHPPRDPSFLLASLRRDPSLRFSQAGRDLLRLLSVQSLEAEAWDQLLAGVPAHCGETVALLARKLSEDWLKFAGDVEQRMCSPDRLHLREDA
ncbi:ParB N-terminal domain-containing protein [Streptomyces sp. NPDC006265]|uniref:ParB/RepB/Spo0J family partition protein n=1 Tax=Streptomyces sp. NPDC006265 TaxID=3156740 RepID=UPI00339FC97B